MSLPLFPNALEIESQPDDFFPQVHTRSRRKIANDNTPDFVYGGRVVFCRSRNNNSEGKAMRFNFGNYNI
jgi:hypothetical protein